MQITKLKIFGFKSFAQKTEINFPTKGLTAVVGPNGCGKSNITDAIRWVLGEQKAALLRMTKMQDVIFSGTEERAAMSLAEVSIVIDNSDGSLASEYSEVIVTRRVHRDGSGEYLINNQECRLRDVHALLFDSGLGSSTYSQMNADMIKSVLSDKADDRRVLFEEAAGVSKYRQQRKEAVRQMERVQMDMLRVEDNLKAVRRAVRQYETQAEKVSEFKRLNKRLRELDLSVSVDKFEDFKEGLDTLNTSANRMNNEVEHAKSQATILQTKIDEKKLSISEEENNFRDLERQVQDATIALNDLNNNIVRLKDGITALEAANEKAQGEIEASSTKVQELDSERVRLEEENEMLRSDSGMEELNALLEKEREQLQVLRDRVDDLRSASRELSNKRLEAANRVNALRGRFERMDAESAMLKSNVDKWNQELENLRRQKADAETAIADIEKGMDDTQREMDNLAEQKSTREERVEAGKQNLQALNVAIQNLRNEEARLQSKIEVLNSVASDGTDASRWIKENKANLIKGLVSDNVDAAPEHAAQVELALGDMLEAVVANDTASAKEIVQALQSENVGQAMLAMPGAVRPAFAGNLEGAGLQGSLMQFVNCDAGLKPWLEGILSRYFLVDSLDSALELSQKYGNEDLCFVAPEAIVRTAGLVVCGTPSAGTLSRKNELAEASSQMENIQKELAVKSDEAANLQSAVDEDAQMLSSIMEDLREKENALRGGDAGIAIQKNLLNQFATRISDVEKSCADAASRIDSANQSKESDADLQAAETANEQAERDYQTSMDQLTENETMLRDKEEDVRELERSAQDKNAKLLQNENRLRAIADQVAFLQNVIQSRRADIEANQVQISKNESEGQAFADQIQEKDAALRDLEGRRDVARERYDVVKGDIDAWQDERDRIRDDMIEKMHDLNEIGRRQEALQANLDRLKERIMTDWNVDLESPEEMEKVEYSQPEADREIRELRGKIKELGPIDVNVMENYEDEKKHLEEVEREFDDLDRARASLDRTITKLDDIARTRYLETFDRIQKNFQFVFSKLFLNGETKMSLVEKLDENGKPMDILDADIEINVRPTGKKMRGIKALSGGEHALTATALLFAIYMEKPSPYCVLDEVDGPLDDANVGRFMALLREFSKQTLFIVVTHNKRTMAEADMLYGVTQEIKGISRIASVQLADATKFAL